MDDFTAAIRRIAAALSVPLSADIVGGFGSTPHEVKRTVLAVLRTGAIGVNLEDFRHGTGKLVSLEKQLERLEAVREAGDSSGIPVVINARTDALRFASGGREEKLKEAIRRSRAYRDWGADCVYPMGLSDSGEIERFVSALEFTTNVMVRKGLPHVSELERLGVARLSFGPAASYAAMGLLKRASREVIDEGTYSKLTDGAITFDELNRLAVRK
jgi:2-methylisocitrate lyase-like PEP mutase family enzyme